MRVCVYPSLVRISFTFCRRSPCIRISPSRADPPTPHLVFNSLANSFKSSSEPMNPVMSVAVEFDAQRLFFGGQSFLLFCIIGLVVKVGVGGVDDIQALFPVVVFAHVQIVICREIYWKKVNSFLKFSTEYALCQKKYYFCGSEK